MADIAGVIHHHGTIDRGDKKVAFKANADGSEVWSAQTDGSLQTRPIDKIDTFETFKLDGNLATANSFKQLHTYVAVDVTGL